MLKQAGIGDAAFVVSGIGSLSGASIRFAGAETATRIEGDLEILTLAGTLSPDGSHLHLSVSDATGRVSGGHAAPGCVVRTTAEVLVAVLPEWRFSREPDAQTGYAELAPRRRSSQTL
ncbi:hypothetical protein D9M68_693600 [compost metagenome]